MCPLTIAPYDLSIKKTQQALSFSYLPYYYLSVKFYPCSLSPVLHIKLHCAPVAIRKPELTERFFVLFVIGKHFPAFRVHPDYFISVKSEMNKVFLLRKYPLSAPEHLKHSSLVVFHL